jgi:hypothetical protein
LPTFYSPLRLTSVFGLFLRQSFNWRFNDTIQGVV